MNEIVNWPVVISEKLPDVTAALPPETIKADQLRVAFMSAFNANPALRECSKMSVCAALVNCASLGIVPNTPEQHAYLIPRGGECQLQIGYRGFCHMILRSGAVAFIDGDVIHEGDEYEMQKGDPVICRFKPNLLSINRREKRVVGAYAVITFRTGEKKLEVMDADDLARIEKAMLSQNRGKRSPAWVEWRSEMLRKAPLKRIAKTSNLGPLVARAAEYDNEQFKHIEPVPVKGPSALAPSGDSRDIPLMRELVDATREYHGANGYSLTDADKQNLTQWLIDEMVIEDTESVDSLTGDRLSAVVSKVKSKVST